MIYVKLAYCLKSTYRKNALRSLLSFEITISCAKFNLLEASADEVHEKCVGATKSYRKVLATCPPLLALAVYHASRTPLRVWKPIISISTIKLHLTTPAIPTSLNKRPYAHNIYVYIIIEGNRTCNFTLLLTEEKPAT